MKNKITVVDVCRVVLGLTFIFSGFVKTVDPWGTALKITEYLNVYGFETLNNYRFGFAIWFCAAELMMGFMLTFKIKTRLISIFAMLIMTFFLVLTFLSATVLPVEDCGCFGDALRLSPWASFGKNVVLWVLALVVWLDARRRLTFFPVTIREWVCTFLFAGLAGGLGTYCYRHLPLIDFLPYKKGVNLREAIRGEATGEEEETRMIYRRTNDGSLHEFSVADTTWWDTTRWEFVEMVESDGFEPGMTLREFAVFDPAGDVTDELVDFPGRVYMLCAVKLEFIKPRYATRFEKIVRRADEEGAKVVLLTATPLGAEGQTMTFGEAPPVRVCNVDATTMITMLRASVGMVVLEDGVIVDKRNCRDIE